MVSCVFLRYSTLDIEYSYIHSQSSFLQIAVDSLRKSYRMFTINVHIIMLVLCGSQFSGQDSIKHTLCVIVQAIFIVASFTKF